MREKTIDHVTGVWFIFGTNERGNVGVSDGTRDVFENLPPVVATAICDAQDAFRQALYTILKDV